MGGAQINHAHKIALQTTISTDCKMGKLTVLLFVVLIARVVYSCQPPDCDHPDCGSCGMGVVIYNIVAHFSFIYD